LLVMLPVVIAFPNQDAPITWPSTSSTATAPLRSYYNFYDQDSYVTSTQEGINFALPNNYEIMTIALNTGLASNDSQPVFSVPIFQFYNDKVKDYYLTSNRKGPGKGYTFVRTEGYVYSQKADGLVELRQYYSKEREDYFLVAEGSAEERFARVAKYRLKHIEGYGVFIPEFAPAQWLSNVPTDRGTPSPFKASTDFLAVEFEGKYATYGGADTWYPTWASDGNLYTPWTDGSVDGVSSNSHVDGGGNSTVGYSTVIGDDPMNLKLVHNKIFTSSPLPYAGRYPCGSVFKDDVWFYGTYSLDDFNGYCGNWCIQGPFVGFMTSTDKGKTWDEPRMKMTGYDDNLFGESAPNNHSSKVKFGAPHVVDFGQNNEHSPGGYIYIVGHGAENSASPTSWMQASEVYMARVKPTVHDVNDRSRWEFYAGEGKGDHKWARGDVSKARPLLTWGNTTGVTTMTYLPAVRKYVMVISTPSISPFTNKNFDTYFLESTSLYGPYSMITYMREFGPESYFVNIPSKFIAKETNPDGSLDVYLSYSANFAIGSATPDPPGSGYHWTLQKMRLLPFLTPPRSGRM